MTNLNNHSGIHTYEANIHFFWPLDTYSCVQNNSSMFKNVSKAIIQTIEQAPFN